MELTPIGVRYAHTFEDSSRFTNAADKIDNTNVYEESNKDIRKMIDVMLADHLIEGSHIQGLDNFETFYNALNEGKRGLILSEHFSNMDLPAICFLLEKCGKPFGPDLAGRIVAMAGMKLNEANPMIKAWASAFTRIVVYPSRSLASITDPAERATEEAKSRKINMASMHAMNDCKKRGQPILVFPSGTRYRPENPKTRQGLREIDSYLRMFDVMIFVSLNGNCLRINPNDPENMLADLLSEDTILLGASPVFECKKFRKEVMADLPDDMDDKKPAVVAKIMNILLEQHKKYQPLYLETYKKSTGKDSDYTM